MTDLSTSTGVAAEDADGLYWDIDAIVEGLRSARHRWRSAQHRHVEHGAIGFPSRPTLEKIFDALCGGLFPLRLGPSFVRRHNEDAFVAETLQTVLSRLYGQIRLELAYAEPDADPVEIDAHAARIIKGFASELPTLRAALDRDVEAAYAGDPAARSVDEVLLCYPGIVAIIHYRLAHRFHELGSPLVARIITEVAHARTGIDIHPGAQIGDRFFIDHGSGVVIGETTIIGDRVRLYQGVTLGGLPVADGADAGRRPAGPRHPIVGNDVVIHSGTTILGPITIGDGVAIEGNLWVTRDVAAGTRLYAPAPGTARPDALRR